MDRIRIATVGYLNARPLTELLDGDRYEVIADHPSAIAALLDGGEVDVALVPVAAVLASPDLCVVPGWCIGADGPVTSVLLVAETPPSQWTHLVLDGVSRSSALLTRLLLAHGPLGDLLSDDLVVVDGEPGIGIEAARGPTASLVIGDVARALPERLVTRLDLAEMWHEWTGLPFVFAVWASRPGLRADVVADLQAAAAAGVARIPTQYQGADLDYLGSALRYPLDDRALMGLRRFAALAHADGQLSRGEVCLLPPVETSIRRTEGLEAVLERCLGGERLGRSEVHQLLSEASLVSLGTAACERRWQLHPERVASYWAVEDEPVDQESAGVVAMVLGGGETLDDRIDDLLRIRALQDATGGVLAVSLRTVAPLSPDFAVSGGTAVELLRTLAVARLVLDNVAHIEIAGVAEGEAVGQSALAMGADDYGVVHTAGPQAQEHVALVERSIREAGFEPVRRNANYERLGAALTTHSPRRRQPVPLPEHFRA